MAQYDFLSLEVEMKGTKCHWASTQFYIEALLHRLHYILRKRMNNGAMFDLMPLIMLCERQDPNQPSMSKLSGVP
jgi:hypothetical protein